MSDSRRNFLAGGSFFLTVNLLERRSDLLVRQIDPLHEAVRRARGIWQRRYWEHTLRDDADFRAHVDYVQINPVKHGGVSRAADRPHASFHRHVRDGLLAADWGGDGEGAVGQAGERGA